MIQQCAFRLGKDRDTLGFVLKDHCGEYDTPYFTDVKYAENIVSSYIFVNHCSAHSTLF